MTNLTITRNQDRYTKCSSCKAEAVFVISNPEAIITSVTPGVEPTGEWVNDQPVYADRVVTNSASWTACERHAKCNAAKARSAKAVTRVFDLAARKWVVQD